MISSIEDLKEKLNRLKKENDYLKGVLNKNKIYAK